MPRLSISSLSVFGQGWDHVACLVNGDIVVRVPWELFDDSPEPSTPRAHAEVALLETLAGCLPVQVPEPCMVADDGTFFAYRHLPGRSVADMLDHWVPRHRQPDLVSLMVEVAVEIEVAVGVPLARRIGLDVQPADRDDLALAASAADLPTLSPGVRRAAEAAIATFEDRHAVAGNERLVTVHGDFGLDHWLVDHSGRPYALIDWSDARVAHPEDQLSTLMWDLPALAVAAAEQYTSRTGLALDRDLLLAIGYLNGLADLAELHAEHVALDDARLRRCLWFVEHWAPYVAKR